MSHFSRYIGIDYSGAETPNSGLKGLRVYLAEGGDVPVEVLPPAGASKYWSRRGVAEWLIERLADDVPAMVGIDHGFSFPLRYFEVHHLLPDWAAFLDDFQYHWPTDGDNVYVDFIRDGLCGKGEDRMGDSRWRRMTEERCRAKSVFHFDVPGSVAKSTHAGIPWLLHLRRSLGDRVHFWPFDGWAIPSGRSAVVEAYPSLWRHAYPVQGLTLDQHDAYTIAAGLADADRDGRLGSMLAPALNRPEQMIAEVEGWILGVG